MCGRAIQDVRFESSERGEKRECIENEAKTASLISLNALDNKKQTLKDERTAQKERENSV
jgi:hypothetical protein